jgi:small conductance mechanosensitive channel
VVLATPTILATDQPPLAADQPSPSQSCLADPLCRGVYDVTNSTWFADSSYYILVKPLRILLILLVALVVRYLLLKTINRLVRTTSKAQVPTILRPLRERVPRGEAAVYPERRRQRAEAIGSVLRNLVSAVVLSIAGLLILSELSFDLGPLLASAGIVGLALGFGAQTLVKDLLAGLFMLVEDQYGVGDTVDLGEATGVVEAIGLRITTVRDGNGVVWYIRNGEIVRVGNKSLGWAMVTVDLPIGFAGVEEATAVMRAAADGLAQDPEYADDFVDPPDVLGVEQVTVDGAIVRTVAKTTANGQFRVLRELRSRLTEALEDAGITAQIAAARAFPGVAPPRPPTPPATPPRPGTPPPTTRREPQENEPPGDEHR